MSAGNISREEGRTVTLTASADEVVVVRSSSSIKGLVDGVSISVGDMVIGFTKEMARAVSREIATMVDEPGGGHVYR